MNKRSAVLLVIGAALLFAACTKSHSSANSQPSSEAKAEQVITGKPGTNLDASYRRALTPEPGYSFSPRTSLLQAVHTDGHTTIFTLSPGANPAPEFYEMNNGKFVRIQAQCHANQCTVTHVVWQGYLKAGTTKVRFDRVAY